MNIQLDHHQFSLNRNEAEYLEKMLSGDVAAYFRESIKNDGGNPAVIVDLDLTQSEQLREQLTVRMAEAGFDEDYAPNKEGVLIEGLIDKLYVHSPAIVFARA